MAEEAPRVERKRKAPAHSDVPKRVPRSFKAACALPDIRTLTDTEIADAIARIPEGWEHLEDEEEGSESECFGSDWSDWSGYSLGTVAAPTQARPKGFENTSDDFWAEPKQGLEDLEGRSHETALSDDGFGSVEEEGLDCIDEKACKELEEQLQAKVVPAREWKTLTALQTLADDHFENFRSVISRNRPLCPNQVLTIGSACTGSDADLASAVAVTKTLRKECPGFGFKYVFHCEIDESKRNWIRAFHDALGPQSQPTALSDDDGE